MSDKVLPTDFSDHSLPGRFEESNLQQVDSHIPKERAMTVGVVIFLVFSLGFFLYYFLNQDEIDFKIIKKARLVSEGDLIKRYNIGVYGSEHVHAAIAMFVDGKPFNFGLPQFQLSSKYIHFENNNPYLIHRHATNAPLYLLFWSIGMEVTSDCITLHSEQEVCDPEGIAFYINGQRQDSISDHVIKQGDRILISIGADSTRDQLKYLESLNIPPGHVSGDYISV